MIVISGAMAASLALPASATAPTTQAAGQMALSVIVVPPSPAQAPLAPPAFGSIRFSGVRTPASIPVRATASRVSRSATRVALPRPAPVRAPAPAPAPAPASRSGGVLGIAASLAGIYYVYGGTTTAGFDCSGYTQYVFAEVGISLPRTAEEQRQATTPVTNPQPGDLVFFGAPAHHVGIYAGDGMMWDSEQSGVPVMLHTDRSERNGGATYGRV